MYDSYLDKANSLDEWLWIKGCEDIKSLKNVNGEITYSDFNTVKYNSMMIERELCNNFKNISSIAEFGCGVGRNLLYLKSKYPHIKCYGYELCENGVNVARKASEKFSIDVEYAVSDYVQQSKFVFPKTDVAFTMYSLEQVTNDVNVALEHILENVNMGSIHLEPIVENYPLTLRGILARYEHRKVGYVLNFEKALNKMRNIIYSKNILESSHNILMFPSLYCIKKNDN